MRSLVPAFLALLAPALAAAQPATPPRATVQPVTARPADVQQFVRAFSVRQGDTPSARWVEPVCVGVKGIAETYAKLVADRVQTVARDAGAPVGAAGCKPNVVVTFTQDAKSLLSAIDRADRSALSEAPEPLRRTMLSGDMPVLWWYRTQLLDQDGRPLRGESAPALSGAVPAAQLDPNVTTTSTYSSSLIRMKTQRGLRGVGVVVDMNRIAGRPLRAVSSFVALVALAELRPGPESAPTALTAWTNTEHRIDDLTALDRAYLRALYATPADRDGDQQRAAIMAQMRAKLAG